MVGTDVDETSIATDVVNTIGIRAGDLGAREVVPLDGNGLFRC